MLEDDSIGGRSDRHGNRAETRNREQDERLPAGERQEILGFVYRAATPREILLTHGESRLDLLKLVAGSSRARERPRRGQDEDHAINVHVNTRSRGDPR